MRIPNLLRFAVLSALYTATTCASLAPAARRWPQVANVTGCRYWDRDLTNVTRWVVYAAPECGASTTAAQTTGPISIKNSVVGNAIPITDSDALNKFQIRFHCKDATPEVCKKAEDGFLQAGSIISSAFAFTVPLVVDAQFRSFGRNQALTLGSASTTRFHLMTDDDGVDRLYPQSLVKQLILPVTEIMSETDIYAEFNADANFWFKGTSPIQPNQHDFTYVVLHELFHGLGFASSWRDYFNLNILSPLPQTDRGPALGATAQGGLFRGFSQFAFDKYMFETARGVPLAESAKSIIAAASSTTVLRALPMTAVRFSQALQGSPVFPEGKRVLSLASIPNSMSFRIPGVNGGSPTDLSLETSIAPYRQGSSISHASSQTSSNTPDFLMRFSLEPGITLGQLVSRIGKGNSFGPIGPNLMAMMGALGYTAQPSPGRGITDFLVATAAAEAAAKSSGFTEKVISAKSFRIAFLITVAGVCSGLFTW